MLKLDYLSAINKFYLTNKNTQNMSNNKGQMMAKGEAK